MKNTTIFENFQRYDGQNIRKIIAAFLFQIQETLENESQYTTWNTSIQTYWPFQGGASFVDHFCYFCFVFVMLSCLFIAALWSPAGKGLISLLSSVWCFIVFCHFHVWCPGSGVVLDCTAFWSLPPYLPLNTTKITSHHKMLVLTGLISQLETKYEDTKQTLRTFMGNVAEKNVYLGLNI